MNQTLHRFVIVYQFGKVASTSLVALLDNIEGTEAVQCHFLGHSALAQMLDIMLNPSNSDYFFEHQLGQFQLNTRITRRMESILSGARDEKLIIISMARNPMDWLRSSITQDIQGYIPAFHELGQRSDCVLSETGLVIRNGLAAMFELFWRVIEDSGGVDAIIEKLREGQWRFRDYACVDENSGIPNLFLMMLRPFSWFQYHFQPAVKVGLSEMIPAAGFWHARRVNTEFLLLKYENMEETFERAARHAGFVHIGTLEKKNVSVEKEFSQDIREAFETSDPARLSHQFSETFYSRFFGYS